MCGRPAAEQRLSAAGLYRREVMRVHAGGRVTHAVDAAKDSKEGTGKQPAVDLLGADPGAEQLAAGDHAVAAARQSGQFPLDSGRFPPYTGAK